MVNLSPGLISLPLMVKEKVNYRNRWDAISMFLLLNGKNESGKPPIDQQTKERPGTFQFGKPFYPRCS